VYDYFTVAVRPVEYFKTNLHPSLEGFKIVLISDVQADRFTNRSRLARYIEKVNAAKPDLVLIAGDIITSTPNYINLGAEFLGKIKSKYGVYSCVGDHDNWAYRNDVQKSLREVKEALANVNVKMLDNEKLTLTIDSAKIGIAFITNTYVERIDPDILDSLTNITNGYDLRIFLTHQPRPVLIEQAHKQKYDLFFAGHTHGGQLTFLFPFYNLSPTLFETKYVRGDFQFDDMLAIVNCGLGMSLVPLRFNSTPEVTVIQLSKK
jgi:predicted MPP superfamily phosphohydrolase